LENREKMDVMTGEDFRRLTGVKKSTFKMMVDILKTEESSLQAKGGRKRKLYIENQLYMTLEYLREYRTYFHIGQSYGVSESTAFKIIRWVEDVLIKHPDFRLPGKKELLKSDNEFQVILVDATECPVERPKKNRKSIIQEKRNDIHKNHKL
jgi:hypothetical protein